MRNRFSHAKHKIASLIFRSQRYVWECIAKQAGFSHVLLGMAVYLTVHEHVVFKSGLPEASLHSSTRYVPSKSWNKMAVSSNEEAQPLISATIDQRKSCSVASVNSFASLLRLRTDAKPKAIARRPNKPRAYVAHGHEDYAPRSNSRSVGGAPTSTFACFTCEHRKLSLSRPDCLVTVTSATC